MAKRSIDHLVGKVLYRSSLGVGFALAISWPEGRPSRRGKAKRSFWPCDGQRSRLFGHAMAKPPSRRWGMAIPMAKRSFGSGMVSEGRRGCRPLGQGGAHSLPVWDAPHRFGHSPSRLAITWPKAPLSGP